MCYKQPVEGLIRIAIFRDNADNPLGRDRSIEDRKRHRQLVEKSIKENLGDILSEENIIGKSKNKKFKIPIRGIKEYQFVFGRNNKGVATGVGEERRGDKISDGNPNSGKSGSQGAGNSPGDNIYEIEVTMEKFMDYIIEDLELPNLDGKKYSEIITESFGRKRDYQRYGINPRLTKKKTVVTKLERKQGKKKVLREVGLDGDTNRFPFREEDLRYHKVKKKPKKESNAVMLFIMDVSGSMDSSKKYLAGSLFFVLSRFIKRKYNSIALESISHTTVAKRVNESEFFHKAESDGTYVSSGLSTALDLIKEKYPPEMWNIYPIYASDGDSWSEDNERATKPVKELCRISNMFGYTELLSSTYSTTMYYRFNKEISCKNFISVIVKEKRDLWDALKIMLSKELKGE